ncbi:conserved hypothetical protein [Frankia canadensis]|uniref:Lipoprotein n=1 Tax=Frankia canadensis TaxID=1836972 RepID=A0A2I2KRX5_9ACTN|nr:hypothetical protein [Frankia canadensis]SNQ48386.1 conserved hypothetical protein [Frankia canadensis]SOU55676.1 conserved hypothetical protein [Frankia canadensis]
MVDPQATDHRRPRDDARRLRSAPRPEPRSPHRPARLPLPLAVAAVLVAALLGSGCGASHHEDADAAPANPYASGRPGRVEEPARPAGGGADGPQLPLGGRTLLPAYRIVAHYGSAGGGALGVLGEGTPDQAARRVLAAAAPFAAGGRPVQPAMELITTVASASPGPDGLYSSTLPDSAVQAYLDTARAHRMLLILDLQPGRGRFLDQARRYERFLREPDVGLALDPEWKMGPTQIPGKQIGSSDAAGLNEVSAWLTGIVRARHLPQKLFVIHQFTQSMLPDRPAIAAHPELATVFHIDGFGVRHDKLAKYALLAARPPFFTGFKLFLDEDTNMFSPAETLALTPPPDLITYQ